MPRRELEKIAGLQVSTQVPLAPLTTFRIGGRAALWLRPMSVAALEKALQVLERTRPVFRIMGHGSNLLVDDRGVPAVLSLSGLSAISMEKDHLVAGAGAALSSLISFCLRRGIGGLEPLCGIPASVGGAVFMNAGANGLQFLDLVDAVLLTGPGGSRWVEPSEISPGYRSSSIPKGLVVSACRIPLKENGSARAHLVRRPKGKGIEIIRQVMKKRTRTQPINLPSAGCIFKNPPGDSAGRLLDLSGLKGRSVGGAAISEKHANFIVNRGGASFRHVMELMELAADQVERDFGVRLSPEVVVWSREEAAL